MEALHFAAFLVLQKERKTFFTLCCDNYADQKLSRSRITGYKPKITFHEEKNKNSILVVRYGNSCTGFDYLADQLRMETSMKTHLTFHATIKNWFML